MKFSSLVLICGRHTRDVAADKPGTLLRHVNIYRPTGTDRRTLSVATGDYLEGRSAGYENQALRTVDVNARRHVVWKFLLFYLDPPARKHSDMFTSLRSIIAIAVATQKHLSYLYKLLAPWQG